MVMMGLFDCVDDTVLVKKALLSVSFIPCSFRHAGLPSSVPLFLPSFSSLHPPSVCPSLLSLPPSSPSLPPSSPSSLPPSLPLDFSIPEAFPLRTSFGRVHATDPDGLDNILYNIPQVNPFRAINGELTLLRSLDFETQ